MDKYRGEVISEGIAIGKVVFFDGNQIPSEYETIPDIILIATIDIPPKIIMNLEEKPPTGIVMTLGTVNSHSSILLRNLLITAISNIPIKKEWEGKYAIIDTYTGELIIDPDCKTLSYYQEKRIRVKEEERVSLKKYCGRTAVTLDGKRIQIYANIARHQALPLIINEADGIGVFKTEFFYIGKKGFPTEEQQFRVYVDILKAMNGKKTVIRTIDIGVDKKPDYFYLPPEPNPALGCRGIRISLMDKGMFITQLRAILRASVYGKTAIMYPMVISTEEVCFAKKLLEEAKQELRIEGIQFDPNIEQGIMIETPAAVMISKELAQEVDFFSIGTNDLVQYMLVADRQNPYVRELLNPYHRGVIRAIYEIVKNAHKAGIWVEASGELAADSDYAKLFISVGIDALAVAPTKILRVKKVVCEFSSSQEIYRRYLDEQEEY